MVHWDQQKVKKSLITKIVVLMVFALAIISVIDDSEAVSGSSGALKIAESMTLPMHELSGAALRTLPDGGFEFIGVSDRAPTLIKTDLDAQGRMVPGKVSQADFGKTLVERFSLCRSAHSKECSDQIAGLTTQWEAVATDGVGRIFVVQETTSNVVVLDPALANVAAVLSFDFFVKRDGTPLQPGKKGSRSLAEGLILLKNGHIIVAKESFPASLVEFGPAGHKALGLSADTLLDTDESFDVATAGGATARVDLVPLATWQRAGESGKCDQSDIAADRDGRLYVLSQKCVNISIYNGLNPDEARVSPESLWTIPPKVKNPEALAVVGSNRFVVGSDIKSDKPNLFLLEE